MKKKIHIKRTLTLFFILFALIYLKMHDTFLIDFWYHNTDNSIIAENTNPLYAGLGQEKVYQQDGYFTTFTTENPHKKTYKEYKQNGTSSWCQKNYWGGTMADNGCGITAMSIILSGYQKNETPETLRRKYAPILNSNKIAQEFSTTFSIDNSDFFYDATHLSNAALEEHLLSNRPILICVWNHPTENRWTKKSHYMVLLATDGNGKVYVSNPNGLENAPNSSGWYSLETLSPYIAKALYIQSF